MSFLPLQVGGDEVKLKRITLRIPAGHDLSGLTFVIRSHDSTAWWRDGARSLHRFFSSGLPNVTCMQCRIDSERRGACM
jgi:hypothetical protein